MLLLPIDDGVAELAQQKRVVNDGEIIGKLALHVPDLFRFTHLGYLTSKNKRINTQVIFDPNGILQGIQRFDFFTDIYWNKQLNIIRVFLVLTIF
jgi:hypothetical protein